MADQAAEADALLQGYEPQNCGQRFYRQLVRLPLRLLMLSCCQV
jgi:hypothetical protein